MLAALATVLLLTSETAASTASAEQQQELRASKSRGIYVPLIIAGVGTTTLAWLTTAASWLANNRFGSGQAREAPSAVALVPLIGPWLSFASSTPKNGYRYSTAQGWKRSMAIGGVAQTLGVIGMMIGVHLKVVAHGAPDVSVSPLIGGGVQGLSIAARF